MTHCLTLQRKCPSSAIRSRYYKSQFKGGQRSQNILYLSMKIPNVWRTHNTWWWLFCAACSSLSRVATIHRASSSASSVPRRNNHSARATLLACRALHSVLADGCRQRAVQHYLEEMSCAAQSEASAGCAAPLELPCRDCCDMSRVA